MRAVTATFYHLSSPPIGSLVNIHQWYAHQQCVQCLHVKSNNVYVCSSFVFLHKEENTTKCS